LNSRNEYIHRINRALQFIEKFYGDNIGLKDIADAAFFSKYHFHRIFSTILGEAPVEYLRRIRLEKAATFLHLYPNYSITRIALNTGFSSSSVFSRSFQNYFGTTPKEFRKRKRSQQSPESIVLSDNMFYPHGQNNKKKIYP
jgi:AraC family transcriptional regulator